MERTLDTRVLYALQPGERAKLIRGCAIAVVVHPDRPPKIIHPDGRVEELSMPESPPLNEAYAAVNPADMLPTKDGG